MRTTKQRETILSFRIGNRNETIFLVFRHALLTRPNEKSIVLHLSKYNGYMDPKQCIHRIWINSKLYFHWLLMNTSVTDAKNGNLVLYCISRFNLVSILFHSLPILRNETRFFWSASFRIVPTNYSVIVYK